MNSLGRQREKQHQGSQPPSVAFWPADGTQGCGAARALAKEGTAQT